MAALAQVSPATVSRVLNGQKASPDRIKAVLAAAEELNFVPNRNAQRLRTRASELIAVVVPDIENSFYTTIVRAIEDVASSESYAVMLCNTDGELDKEARYLAAVLREPVAGIISAPVGRDTDFTLAALRGVPVVTIDRRAGSGDLDWVVIDNERGAAECTAVLFDQGYRRVGCISGPQGVETAEQRAAGWRAGVRSATGRDPDADLLIHAPYAIAGGRSAMAALLEAADPPDAVFAANNKLAIGALRHLHDRGGAASGVAVYSFGELPLVTFPPEGLFVAGMPMREMGTLAAQMLLERIHGLADPARGVVLEPFVARDGSDQLLAD